MPAAPNKQKNEKDGWLKIELSAPEALIDALTDFLTDSGAQGVYQESPGPRDPDDPPTAPSREPLQAFLPCDDQKERRVAALQTYLDSLAELFPEMEKPRLRTEVVRDPGWGEAWKQFFKPLRVGRNIVIKPTWEPYVPAGADIVVEIDPGMAFGTGHHASTRMCLEAIETLLSEDRASAGRQVLDVGTGTGILGIAAARLGAAKVLCIDNDEQAVEIARENVLINGVGNRVALAALDIAALTSPFPLVTANLSAKILLKLHPHLSRLVCPQGYLILAGIIEPNRRDIEECFLRAPFSLHRLNTDKEWLCYVLKKEGSGP
jgi:ribosomal protein L11 methyltransferase